MIPRLTVDARMLHASGIGTYLRSLVPRVVASRPGYRFCLMGNVDELAQRVGMSAGNVETRTADAPIYSVREQLELAVRIPEHTHLFWSPHYNIPLLRRGKLLVTVHDVLHLARPEYVSGIHRRLYARAMFRAVRTRASTILCDSHFTADELVRHAGVDRRAIVVVHIGVDPFWSVPPATPPPDRPYLLFVGNVKPHKNVRGVIEAFALLRDQIPHDLVILGRREGFITGDPDAERRAAELGERVRFTGYVAEEEVRARYAHASALLFPSFYEGFGLPPLEAMAAGCPVIVSRAASLPEVCGDAALYCDAGRPDDLAEKIRTLLCSQALRQEMREAGLARSRQFTWERCARETAAVIDLVYNA